MASQFTGPFNRLISLKIPVNPPFLKPPEPVLNALGLPIRDYYTTQDVCKLLKIKPDTFRNRLERRYYPEPKKVGGKRRFSEMEIREMLKITKELRKKGIFKAGKD